ncbi:hypothetical protein PHAVU_006G176700 [Phaseolus vulgaris]
MMDTWLGPTFCNTLPLSLSFPLSARILSSSFSSISARILSSSFSSSSSMATSSSHHHRRCYSNTNPPHPQPSLLVFSGGTAFNGVVEELKNLTNRVAHVLPVSDDGGSTAEIVRVLGGPAVGDIRSRCLRLSDQSTVEALAVRNLLGHRLPLDSPQAKSEWYSIVEGDHFLWKDVSKPYRETIRAFLVYFQNQILRRAEESFCFRNGSIGNFFFAGARIFFQSLDAAIFLFSRVSDIPPESLVLPVISTNDRLTLGCELWDGTIIRGQNEISHPTRGTIELIKKGSFSAPALPSRIKRVFYMSSEGKNLLHEVLLKIGEIIYSRSCLKVLVLNGTWDRETNGFSASCFVTAITDALNRTYGEPSNRLQNLPNHYINTLLVPRDGEIPVDIDNLAAQGIFDVIVVDSLRDPKVGIIYDPSSLIRSLADLTDKYMKSQVMA